MALKDYLTARPEPPRVQQQLATVYDAINQAEAIRGDLADHRAQLRAAGDQVDAATANAGQVLYALDERKTQLTRAAEQTDAARALAADLRGEVKERHSDLLGAMSAAQGVRLETEHIRQQQHALLGEIDAARFDLKSFLDDVRLAREEVHGLQAQSRPYAPGALPGDAPGSVLSTVPQLYPGGPSVLGFLLTQISATDLTTGITLPGGPALTFTATPCARSGAFGLILDKPDKTDTSHPDSYIFAVGGNPLFEWGIDFNTNNTINGGTGGSYLAMFDHTANANAGADIWALSPAEQDSVSVTVKATKWAFSGTGTGSAKDLTHLATLTTGTAVDLGGISMTIKSATARDHLTLVNAHATSKRNAINFGGLWKMGSDLGGAGTSEFILRDVTNSLNRLYIENTAALLAKLGINTTAPLANLYSAVSADASLFDVIQTGLGVGYSTINNRTWQVQYILDAAQVEQFTWHFGTLGSASTRAVPTATSATLATGIKANQLGGDLISAASGTNTAIVSALNWASAAGAPKIGFLGGTAVVKQVGASAAGIAAVIDPNARAALTAIQAALFAFALVTNPA